MKNTRNYTAANFLTKAIAVFLALCILLGAAGCSGKGSEDKISILIPQPTAGPEPVAGGSLSLPMPVNAAYNSPLSVNTQEMLLFYSLVFESLIEIDENNMLVPCLAEKWECDKSGRVWTLTLRSNVKWHGSNLMLTAADVVYSWNQLTALCSGTSGCYYSYCLQNIESIAAQDSNAVVVTMKNAGLLSLYSLTFPILCPNVSSSHTAAGTGPYQVKEVTGNSIALSVNSNWWKTLPYLESIVFYERDNNETALASYEAGQLNMVPTAIASVGKYREEGVTNVLDVMTQNAEVMLFNQHSAALSDPNIRKAIAYALDRNKLISNVYMNRARAADVPIPPDSWLYESKSKVYDYNLSKALDLMKQAGWIDSDGDGILEKDGSPAAEFTLTLLVNDTIDNALRKEAATMIASQLLALGIKVEIVTAAHTLGNETSEYMTKLNGKDYDLALAGFRLGIDANLSDYLKANGKRNYTGYSSEALNALADDLNVAADEAACRAAASKLQQKFVEELPFLVLYFRQESVVYSADIQGVSAIRQPDLFRNVAIWYMYTKENK